MRLYFVGLELSLVASFQCFWIVVSLKNLIPARLVFLGCDVIWFVVMVVGSFSKEFGVGWGTMVPAYNKVN